tara:strand:- start:1082 stop:1591 length:510 start_codon:yes stop_codon:yes gene_type:complete
MCSITAALAATSIVVSLYGMRQQQQAMKRQEDIRQQQLALEMKQRQQQAEGAALEMNQQITRRKDQARIEYKQNRTFLTTSGAEIEDSPSFGRFFASNVKAKKKDVRNIRMMGIENQLNAQYGIQQTGLSQQASRSAYKSSSKALTTQTVGNAFGTLASANIDYDNLFS